MNKIYAKSFRNAIGIGARAFRSDYGGVILLGGLRGGDPIDDYPPHKITPNEVKL